MTLYVYEHNIYIYTELLQVWCPIIIWTDVLISAIKFVQDILEAKVNLMNERFVMSSINVHVHTWTNIQYQSNNVFSLRGFLFTVCKSSFSYLFYSHSCTDTHTEVCKQYTIIWKRKQGTMEVKMWIVYTKSCYNKRRRANYAVMKVILRWRTVDMPVCGISDVVQMNTIQTAFKVTEIFSSNFRGQRNNLQPIRF